MLFLFGSFRDDHFHTTCCLPKFRYHSLKYTEVYWAILSYVFVLFMPNFLQLMYYGLRLTYYVLFISTNVHDKINNKAVKLLTNLIMADITNADDAYMQFI